MTHVWRRLLCLAPFAVQPAHAADLFMLDQRYGSIAFSVNHFGAFSSSGTFPHFIGRLLIDRLHPEQTKIDVDADATAVTVAWQDGTEMLRGPEFFDAAHYREIHFSSSSIKGVDPKHFEVDGTLEIRGIKHPLTLEATLLREETDTANGTEIADFTVKGTLSRSDYGMTTQPIMISDQVRIQISARIELPAQKK